MRLFIAANIPEDIRSSFADLTSSLSARLPGVRWVRKENFHVTLKFLGEVSERRIEKMSPALAELAHETKPFTISFEGLGAFPDLRRPHVLWVGIDRGVSDLRAIAEGIKNRVWLEADRDEREFSGHVTIGRVARPIGAVSFVGTNAAFGSFELDRIDLMQSVTLREGPEYHVVRSFPLGGRP